MNFDRQPAYPLMPSLLGEGLCTERMEADMVDVGTATSTRGALMELSPQKQNLRDSVSEITALKVHKNL